MRTSKSIKLVAALAAAASVTALGVGTGSPAGAAGITPHRIKVDPAITRISSKPGPFHFGCQDRPIDGSQGIRCESPAQMQKAYGVTPLLARGQSGHGRTIVIVDAYQNPYIASDLALQNKTFALPKAHFSAIAPQGVPAFDPNDANQVGWGGETTLDVLWAHAIAPGAKIVLVEAASNQDTDILAATKYAVDHNLGDVLSQSFGENESCVDPALLAQEHQVFQQATQQGWTIFASSGDSGASQFTCDGSGAVEVASSPASDPLVTGVGGTTLNAAPDGTYIGETAWTEGLFAGCNPPAVAYPADINCSGGGFSTIYPRPAYQYPSVPGSGGRGVPDVAYNAGVNGGVLTVCTVCDPANPGSVYLFGGTSAGSPQWAGLAAIGDQLAHRRLGLINPALYALSQQSAEASAFHDVTTGNNDVAEIGGGYDAGDGWDPVTGIGTPNAVQLLPELAATSR